MDRESLLRTIKDAFDQGHKLGRNEVFRQIRDIRASQKAHERMIRREWVGNESALRLHALAVSQLAEIDKYINILLPAVYKEGGE